MTGRERREQLIAIGRALFAEKGYDGASIEEVSARAGVSKPVVYEHFGGKEGLHAVIVDRAVQDLMTRLLEDHIDLSGNRVKSVKEEDDLTTIQLSDKSVFGNAP